MFLSSSKVPLLGFPSPSITKDLSLILILKISCFSFHTNPTWNTFSSLKKAPVGNSLSKYISESRYIYLHETNVCVLNTYFALIFDVFWLNVIFSCISNCFAILYTVIGRFTLNWFIFLERAYIDSLIYSCCLFKIII